MNKRSSWIVSGTLIVVTLAALALVVGFTLAQDTGPDIDINEASSRNETSERVYNVLPIQGRLTDDNGNPIDGYRTMTFTLYATSWDDIPLCQDDDSVQIENGLFAAEMDWCDSTDIDGKRLFLGIQVEGDDEMVPRERIYPVPYAFSLRPGAIISGSTSSAVLHVENWHASGRGIRAYAMSETGTNYGMVGSSKSPDGYGGYFYNTGGGTGLRGKTNSVDNNYGFYSPDNLYSLNIHSTGATMQIVQNGGETSLEAGDVVAFSGIGAPSEQDGQPVIQVAEVTSANSTAVAGVVYSGYDVETLHTVPEKAAPGDYLLVVVRGPVQVKASAVAGALRPGDLLSSADQAGYAAKAASVAINGVQVTAPGTIVGKVLEPLDDGSALIYAFVTLQ